uniref:Zinc transporter 9 n=1 Tax=Panagrolaimus sp. ES5 TaxID=591445 RepID=A0AC34GXH4_9BILA
MAENNATTNNTITVKVDTDVAPKKADNKMYKIKNAEVEHGDDVVIIALIINIIDTILKFVAAYLTLSKSLFAEGVHTAIDTLNQAILYVGIKSANRSPSPKYPYGYGNIRYVTALMAGCGIFFLGCGLSLYHGIDGILEPEEMEPHIMAYIALGVSGLFSGASAIQAFYKVNKLSKKAKVSFYDFVMSGTRPSLNVVLFEDTAAVIGVLIATVCYFLSTHSTNHLPDSIGSILVGLLLGFVAIIVIRTNSRALLGKSLPSKVTGLILERMKRDPVVNIIDDVKATSVGIDSNRFKAEVDFNGKEITKRYLEEKCDVATMLNEVGDFKTTEELHEWLINHGEGIIDQLATEIDRIESIIRANHPHLHYVDIEPL